MSLDSELGPASGKPQESAGSCFNDVLLSSLAIGCATWYTIEMESVPWWRGVLLGIVLLLAVFTHVPRAVGMLLFFPMMLAVERARHSEFVFGVLLPIASFILMCVLSVGLCGLLLLTSWKVAIPVLVGYNVLYYGVAMGGAALMR